MMLHKQTQEIHQDKLDEYLLSLAKEYKKENRDALQTEVILVGGASVIINFSFRKMTTDADAYIGSYSSMKGAIERVANKYDLRMDWLNDDFTKTSSFSNNIRLYSKPYKTFLGYFEVRTITDEYLVAMKLMAGREYKHDLSDIAGILFEKHKAGKDLSLDEIKVAVKNLYGSWDALPLTSREFIENVFANISAENYEHIAKIEETNKSLLIEHVVSGREIKRDDNIHELLEMLNNK